MKAIKYNRSSAYANMYVLEEDNHLIIVDPCEMDIDTKEKVVDYIFLTHEHYDHISGVDFWRAKTNAKVLCSKQCGENIREPRINLSYMFKEFCELQTVREITDPVENVEYVTCADITFEDTGTVEWCGNELKMFTTPGHSAGSSSLLVNGKMLFSGDTLFRDYPVVGMFPGSCKDDWKEISVPRFRNLSGDIKVCPGHFDSFLLRDYNLWDKGLFLKGRRK